ncbi:hypothetical protein HDU76_006715 [Blyttiomyces sp. JEL0837]|nr:hypothetical protein HDU76_006715 [Blyttiomyces sp. JEL0837]
MPPKSAKNVAKDKKKVVEDKTFGLKNKNKSAKVGKYVEQVKSQVDAAGNKKAMKEAEDRKNAIASKKAAEEAKKAELAELFKPVQGQQKVPFGVDPKTIVCNYFKAGTCQKGSKCKFSHDLNVERKGAKIDLYTDNREDGPGGKEADTMDKWDDSKLQAVVNQKQEASNKNLPTEIVCKFFLDAIESRKYGWFWECPNGGKACKYRHALPPGYVLKKRETEAERREREAEEKENAITFEEFLDEERHKLGPNLTPINDETFKKWKADRKARQKEEDEKLAKEKQDAFKKFRSGMKTGMSFSGKELFDFNPELARDLEGGDEDGAMDFYERDGESDHDDDQVATAVYLGEDGGKVDDVLTESVGSSLKGKAGDVVVTEELYDEIEGLDDDDDDDDDEDEEGGPSEE